MSIIGELSTAIYAGFRFPHLVRREFDFLSGLGWSFEDRSSKEVLAVKDRMTVRITFRLQGPSLLSLNLWITPDPATDTEAMKRLTGMADCGPIRY